MEPGTVYIVGAGPGDPLLITVRGQRCLSSADVVVHDHLVHPRLLRLAPARAERIDVGAAAPQPLEQDAINLLLAEKAREGRTVVRLKWGDPFVFDSGGKEALFLHEQSVPFEVVPGVTAPVAAPAYAGVPVTYPGGGDVLVFIRGHEDGSYTTPKIDWKTVAAVQGTLVCYAGARQLPSIIDALIAHGRSPKEWTALVSHGTLPQQRTLHGTLGELQERLKGAPQKDPAVLVVGAVAGLREHLRWFDARPLFGRRVIVTRTREQAGDLVQMLEDLGAEAIEAPSIRVAPPQDEQALEDACASAPTYDWIVFTTANGVDAFMRRLLAGSRDVRHLKGPQLCAVGLSTAERLSRYGIKVDLVPIEYQTEPILQSMREAGSLSAARVLLPRAEGARDTLAEELRRAGAEVVEVDAFRTVRQPLPSAPGRDIYKMLLDGEIDVVTFTSPSSVRNFVQALGEDQAADLLRMTIVACIGPVTADACERLEIEANVIPKDYTMAGLVAAIVEHVRGQ
jgi:uroporphyrinogen III methyltransferase/synthase